MFELLQINDIGDVAQNSENTRCVQKHFKNAYFVGIICDPYDVLEGVTSKSAPCFFPIVDLLK